ncbi:hypothetical protein M1L60_09875 [Actinoplanes sp. TRM 88003]|uniref:EcsC family protein n=1 Tax=Paractinoplanes aksuensis TaxID=2939490 RepID=A0ABT1DJC6_9ACTN|nr:hypothetical protein [Actinoplanes aksuensis]MCO8270899.1 hypothetical protein [Actinoplanes aksuensis]
MSPGADNGRTMMSGTDHTAETSDARALEQTTAKNQELAAVDADLGQTVAALTADDLEPGGRRQLLGRLVGDIRRRGMGQLFKPKAALRWMGDVVADVAPHVPVRDIETLRRHFPGLTDDDLADRLIRNAANSTAGVGAAGGGVAAVEWAAPPTLLTAPVLLAAETVAVVAVELKLVGELHEIYGQPIRGGLGQRAASLIQAWSQQRGVNPLVPGVGVASVLGTAARKELQSSLLKRFGRSLTTLGPMLTGAAVAGYLNRRATKNLGEHIKKDLRKARRKVIDG